MGTARLPADRLSVALFGKARRAILGLLLSHADEAFYMRQIVRAVALGQGAVQRELTHLTAAGLLVRTRQGQQVYYQANRRSPIFPELKSLLVKTAGVGAVLRSALAGLADRIRVACVYGSVARGTERASSDVDLVVVGRVTFADVVNALSAAQRKLQREINPSVYTPEEFRKKLRARHHFVTTLLHTPKFFLMGNQREFARLGA